MNYQLDKINIYSKSIKDLESYLINSLHENNSDQIVTFNLDFYRNTKFNDEFKTICETSKLVLADGAGITSLIKLKYGKTIERITGHDIFILLLQIADRYKLKVALVGSTEKVLSIIKNKIEKQYSNCILIAMLSPPKFFERDDKKNNKIIELLKEAEPEILFAALGSPRQEIWLSKNKNEVGAKINVGVGSVFDYYSGQKKRCPLFLQKLKLEWFWRLLFEPTRLFKRYILNDIPFFIAEFLNILKSKGGST